MRPIDADALIKDIENVGKSVMFTSHHERMVHDDKIEFAIDAIEGAPTIEAEPVRHGEWNVCEIDRLGGTIIIECTECTAVFKRSLSEYGLNCNFCSNCGAIMDGGTEE